MGYLGSQEGDSGTAAQRSCLEGGAATGGFITAGSEAVWLERVVNEYAFLVELLVLASRFRRRLIIFYFIKNNYFLLSELQDIIIF